jgi:hypothetical protein
VNGKLELPPPAGSIYYYELRLSQLMTPRAPARIPSQFATYYLLYLTIRRSFFSSYYEEFSASAAGALRRTFTAEIFLV